MKGQDELLCAWVETHARRGDDVAIFNSRGEPLRTFHEINEQARALQPSGEVYPIALGNHPDWPATLLACLRRGVVALPLDESTTEAQRAAALRLCEHADWGEHRPVLLKLTSGTTAAPRAIRFRSAQLLADCDQICETMGITERDLNFAVIPLSHSYGFSNLVTPLIARGVPMVLSSDRMPRAVLDNIARTDATVFPGMPVFFQAFCEMEPNVPMPKLRLCISAGAPLPLAVARKFRDRFGLTTHSFYGSSECGGICYDREAPLVEAGFVGEAMHGVNVTSLDDGRIEVRSAAVADGYFPDGDEARLTNGRFVPDDLLARGGSGFRIVGRNSDVINVAGKKVNPAEVEAILLEHAAVTDAVVFARASQLRNEEVAACVVAPTAEETELLEFCRQRLSGWQVPKRLFFVARIPTNERGKVSRRALGAQFAQEK